MNNIKIDHDVKVLLIGGSGTLSKAVLKESMVKGYTITIMNRGIRSNTVPNGVEHLVCDVKNEAALKDVLSGRYFDVVVDFVSRIPSETRMLFSVFSGICKQYIFISTACVYRRCQEDMPIKENSPKPNKNWSYNVEKFECEETLKSLSKDSKAYYTIVRPYITYDNERIPFGIAPEYKYHRTIIERIKSGKPMFVWGDGQTMTTSTYVSEFAVGLVGLFLNDKARNEDFHITSSMSYPVIDVLTLLFEKLGKKPQIVHLTNEEMSEWLPQYRSMLLGDRVLPAVFDNSKIKSAVPEYESKITLSEGLDKILEYYNNKSDYDYDYKYDALIDLMLANKGVKCGYKQYTCSSTRSRLMYSIYRYFQYTTANRICHLLKLI